MKKKLIGDNIEPKCAYCKHSKAAPDKTKVLCPKKGVMDLDYSCKKFSYDPLKRVPVRTPDLQQFSKEDFSLD